MKRNVDFYVKKRNELIDLLDEEKITKQEFISRNNVLINSFNLRPFTDIKTVNEGVFNYQYYNLKAKEYNTIEDFGINRIQECWSILHRHFVLQNEG